jgi:nucleotide-binding universal stress UspA family protein
MAHDRELVFTPPIEGGIVVGHDASASADRALRWAAEEAGLRNCPLHVVRAWRIHDAPRPAHLPPGVVPSEDEFAEAVTAELKRDVEAVAAPGLVVHLHPMHAYAEAALVAASAHADLLVVSSRGRGRVARLLGSTSSYVVEHADCPVVVLRG